MALREIRNENDPILRKISRPVVEITDRINNLIDDMIETMDTAGGVGIAAPQVGVLKRIFIILDENSEPIIFINPEIIEKSGAEEGVEGCLSVNSVKRGFVERPTKLKVKAFDRNMNEFSMELNDFIAREFCHEYDHLDGILFIDKMTEEYIPEEYEEEE